MHSIDIPINHLESHYVARDHNRCDNNKNRIYRKSIAHVNYRLVHKHNRYNSHLH